MSSTSLIRMLSWIASLLLLHEFVGGFRSIQPMHAGLKERLHNTPCTLHSKNSNKCHFMSLETSYQDTSVQNDKKWWRPLGSYEILLSGNVPKMQKLALSHSAAFKLNTKIAESELLGAICHVIKRHPMLRSAIASHKGKKYWYEIQEKEEFLAKKVLTNVRCESKDNVEMEWKNIFDHNVNGAWFAQDVPQWRMYNVVGNEEESFWVFSINHGMDDQQSVNIMVKDMLEYLNKQRNNSKLTEEKAFDFPPSIETAITSDCKFPTLRTIHWSLYQMMNSIVQPALIPDQLKGKLDSKDFMSNFEPSKRKTLSKFFYLTKLQTSKLVQVSRTNGVTITQLLASCMSLLSAILIRENSDPNEKLPGNDVMIRVLLSVGLRPYGQPQSIENDFTGGTVACASGAVDYLFNVQNWNILVNYLKNESSAELDRLVGDTLISSAKSHKDQFQRVIKDFQFVPESVRLFNIGMNLVDVLQAVDIDAKGKGLGRAYTCGVSNVGATVFSTDEKDPVKVLEGYYGTSHSQNGVLAQLSAMSIDGKLCGCLQFPIPILYEEETALFQKRLSNLLVLLSSHSNIY